MPCTSKAAELSTSCLSKGGQTAEPSAMLWGELNLTRSPLFIVLLQAPRPVVSLRAATEELVSTNGASSKVTQLVDFDELSDIIRLVL